MTDYRELYRLEHEKVEALNKECLALADEVFLWRNKYMEIMADMGVFWRANK